MIITGCDGYEMGNGRAGVLLLHGFTGTPRDMRPLADHLASRGFFVTVPRLPGHARDAEDMRIYGREQWIAAVMDAWTALTRTRDSSCIAGLSMGALLGLHAAARGPAPRALACLSTPLILHSGVARLARPFLRLYPFRTLYYVKKTGMDVRNAGARADYPCYTRVPMPGVVNFLDLVDQVRGELSGVTAPLLIIHALNDHTAPPSNAPLLRSAVRSAVVETLYLEKSFHVVTVDVEQDQVRESVCRFFRERTV